ncbi:ATP-dependent metallopeptidase FtsH/Yme1/Tma family protein, partial [Candidatus Bipolaricaulota bacterium]|nr:ATP-dependent metallopeptidase FtsH/Yme1/Tma family protein [Candidatus Bipolaricaulota bacterium]
MERDPLRDMRNRNLRNIAFITIVVILGLILLQSWFGGNNDQNEISYSLFRTFVESDQVAQVTIKDNIAEAVMVDQSTLTARLPEDATLYATLLDEHVPEVTYKAPSTSGLFVSILISLLPIVLLIGVWIFIMRRTQAGGGALSFGQSKAKLVQPDTTEITFDDVAGSTEVKEEVAEIVEYLRDQKRFIKLGAEIPKGILLVGAPG